MNRIYKVIFNHFLGLWQCVSELTKSHGKPSSTQHSLSLEQRAQPSATGQTLVLSSPLKLTTLVVLGAISGMMALPALAEERMDVIEAMRAQNLIDHNEGSVYFVRGYQGTGTTPVDGHNKKLILNAGQEVVINAGQLKNADLVVEGIYHLTNNNSRLWPSSTFAGTLLVTGTGQIVVDNYGTQTTDNQHFELGAGSGISRTTPIEMTVENGGSVSVRHMIALSGPGQTTLNVNQGGTVKAVGLKFGQVRTGTDFASGRTATLNMNGGKIDVTTIRGLTKVASYSQAQYSNNTVKAEAHFSGGGEIVIGSMAGDLGYLNANYSSYDNSALFRFFYTEGSKSNGSQGELTTNATPTGLAVVDTITIDGDGLVINAAVKEGEKIITPITQFRAAGFSGSGTLTKKGKNTFVITAANTRFTGNVVVQEGTLEVGGAGLWVDAGLMAGRTPTATSQYFNPDHPKRDFTLTVNANNSALRSAFTVDSDWQAPEARPGFGEGDVIINKDAWLVLSPWSSVYGGLAVYDFNNDVSGEGGVRIATPDTVVFRNSKAYSGDTVVEAGTLQITGSTTQLANLADVKVGNIYANAGASIAKLEVTDGATVKGRGRVLLAEGGDGEFLLDHSTLHMTAFQHGQAATGDGTSTKATFTMQNHATLVIDRPATAPEGQIYKTTLFAGFDTTRGDSISVGMGGGDLNTWNIREGVVAMQDSKAAIRGIGGWVELIGGGRLIIQARNTDFGGNWQVKDGILQIGSNAELSKGSTAPIINYYLRTQEDTPPQYRLPLFGELKNSETGLYSATLAFGNKDEYTLNYSIQSSYQASDNLRGNLLMVGGDEAGQGTLIITAEQTYQGQTQIANGTISLRGGSSTNLNRLLGENDAAYVVTGYARADSPLGIDADQQGERHGTLEFKREASAGAETFNRKITGTGGIRMAGDNQITLQIANHTEDGHYDYTGKTEVVAGTLVLANGQHIDQTSEISVGATTAGTSDDQAQLGTATFILKGDATVNGMVNLAESAASHTMNTLVLDGATLAAKNVKRGTAKDNTTDTRISLVMKEGATLKITEDGTLFDEFHTDQRDTVQIGANGAKLAVANAKLSVQSVTGAITDTNDGTEHHNLTKTGQGALVLAAKNAYSGTFSIAEGAVQLGKSDTSNNSLQSALDAKLGGRGAITLGANTTLQINLRDATQQEIRDHAAEPDDDVNENGAFVLSRQLTGEGNFVQVGTGTTILKSNENNYTGTTKIARGTLQVGEHSDAKLGGRGDIENYGTLVYATVSDGTIDRVIKGTGNFRQAGDNTLTMKIAGAGEGHFTYSGKTEVVAGTLVLDDKQHLDNTSAVNVGAIAAGTEDEVKNATFIMKGSATVHGKVNLAESAASHTMNTLVLDGATLLAQNVQRGTAANSTEDTRIKLAMKEGALLRVTESGTLFSGFDTTKHDAVTIGTGGASIEVLTQKVTQDAKAAITDEGAGTDHHFTKTGRGELVLTAANSYHGKTTISAGVLTLGDGTQSGAAAKLGGDGAITIGENACLTINLKNASGTELASGDTDINANGALVLARQLTGVGQFVQQGPGTTILTSNDNNYTGATGILGGVLQVGDHSDAQLGGTGVIVNDGRLVYSTASDMTLDRVIVGTGAFQQKGHNTLKLTGANTFTGKVYVTEGTLHVESLQALGNGDEVVFGDVPTDTATDTSTASDESTVRPRARMALRALRAAVQPTTEEPNLLMTNTANPSARDGYAILAKNTSGAGNVILGENTQVKFTSDYTYAHSGETRVDTSTSDVRLDKDANLASSQVNVVNGRFSAGLGAHHVGGFTQSGTAKTTLDVDSMSEYAQIFSTGAVALDGELYINVKEAATREDFATNKILNVIKSESALSGTFTKYGDSSLLFNFTPEYHYGDADGHVMHLIVSADRQLTCSREGMGDMECIVRQKDHTRAVPSAKVLDEEFDKHPGSKISQYFYSIDDDDEADRAVEESLPLMTGSVNSILTNDARALALFAPRDPCDPTTTEHGYNLWAQLGSGHDRQDALLGATGYRGEHTSVAVGSDVCSRDTKWRLGAFVGYTDSDIRSRGTAMNHTAKTDLYQIGIYGDRETRENQDIDFVAGYAHGRIHGTRHLSLAKLKADSHYGADIWYAGLGYNWRGDVVSPFVRFDYAYTKSGAYHESGADVFNYQVKSQSRQSGVVQLGYQFKGQPTERLSFTGRAAVGYELLDKTNTITAAYDGIAGKYFDTTSAEDSRLMGLFDLGLQYRVNQRIDLGVKYRAQLQSDYQNQVGEVRMTMHF